jgi:hypothetical protein
LEIPNNRHLDEVRQRALAEAEGDALSLDVLLADASNDLKKTSRVA